MVNLEELQMVFCSWFFNGRGVHRLSKLLLVNNIHKLERLLLQFLVELMLKVIITRRLLMEWLSIKVVRVLLQRLK